MGKGYCTKVRFVLLSSFQKAHLVPIKKQNKKIVFLLQSRRMETDTLLRKVEIRKTLEQGMREEIRKKQGEQKERHPRQTECIKDS